MMRGSPDDVMRPNVALESVVFGLLQQEPVERVERLDARLDALPVPEPERPHEREVDDLAPRPS